MSTLSVNRDYDLAIKTLLSLTSNLNAIADWRKTRLENKEVTLENAMTQYLNRINLDISPLRCIHVTGTKGKGSTCAFTENILRTYGLKTGLYTSPNLVHVRERIRINGIPLSKDLFAKYFWEIYDPLNATKSAHDDDMPSYFRFLTLLGFKVFISEKVDVAIIEVGIGGRTDATNIIKSPAACGISTLDFDHCNVLGDTLKEIAYEKSGIFKKGCPAFSVPQKEDPMATLISRANELPVSHFQVVSQFSKFSSPQTSIELGLDGDYQKWNAALAIEMTRQFLNDNYQKYGEKYEKVKNYKPFNNNEVPKEFTQGLKHCKWPGRSQTISLPEHKNLSLYIDGAHTLKSIKVCMKWFKSVLANNEKSYNILIFNCKTNKDSKALMSVIVKQKIDFDFDKVVFCNIDTSNEGKDYSTSWQEANLDIWKQLNKINNNETDNSEDAGNMCNVFGNIPSALDAVIAVAKQQQPKHVRVIATGSLYLAGGFLEVLINQGVLSESVLDL